MTPRPDPLARPPWDRQKLAAAVPVAAVAIIAAIVSYGHIETLALAVHQPLAAARLLPFAVDFLIVSGSVILLAGSALGWVCVVPGIAATVFANTMSAAGDGWLAGLVAAWPAVAFTIASFVLERWLHSRPGAVPETVAEVPAEDNGHDPVVSLFRAEIEQGKVPGIRVIRERVRCGQPKAQEIQAKVRTLLAA